MLSLQRRRTEARFYSRRGNGAELRSKDSIFLHCKKDTITSCGKNIVLVHWAFQAKYSLLQGKPYFNSLKSEINILEGSVMVYGYFISTAHWKYSLFLRFFPWRDPLLRHFSGYPFRVSGKKHQPFSITQPFRKSSKRKIPLSSSKTPTDCYNSSQLFTLRRHTSAELSMQRKGADRPVAENEAGTDARIGKSLERERGGLEGGGRSLSSERFSLPPPIHLFHTTTTA